MSSLRHHISLISGLALGATMFVTSTTSASADDSWSVPRDISPSNVNVAEPKPILVGSSDGVHLISAWRTVSSDGLRVMLRSSSNGGHTWSTASPITRDAEQAGMFDVEISSDGRIAVVVWASATQSGAMFARVSTDGGESWGTAVGLNDGVTSGTYPDIAVSANGKEIAAAWTQAASIVVRASHDSGASWDASLATISPAASAPFKADIAGSSDGSTLYVSWAGTVSHRVQLARSRDFGNTWTIPLANSFISDASPGSSNYSYTECSNDGERVFVYWGAQLADATYGNRSSDYGATWLSSQQTVNADFEVSSVDASPDGSLIGITMNQSSFVSYGAATVSNDSGSSWSSPHSFSSGATGSSATDIHIDANGTAALAMWQDISNHTLYVSSTSRSGADWSQRTSFNTPGIITGTGNLASSADQTWTSMQWAQTVNSDSTLYFTRTAPAPTLAGVSPSQGSTLGGTQITLTGTGFVTGAAVTVGNIAATSVSVESSTRITAMSPAASAGMVDIVVTNPDGQSATLTDAFTVVTPISPKKTMEPTKPMAFAGGVKPGKWGSVLSVPVVMNSGTIARISVTAKIGKKKASKKFFKTRTHKKHLQLWSSGKKKVTVDVTVHAAETDAYSAFTSTKTYVIKKK